MGGKDAMRIFWWGSGELTRRREYVAGGGTRSRLWKGGNRSLLRIGCLWGSIL